MFSLEINCITCADSETIVDSLIEHSQFIDRLVEIMSTNSGGLCSDLEIDLCPHTPGYLLIIYTTFNKHI